MAIGWTGAQSAGKSQLLAVHAVEILHRNIKWINIRREMGLEHIPRKMAFDSPMSPAFIKAVEDAGMEYIKFSSLSDVMPLSDIDIFIHEIVSWFPQRGSEPLTPEQSEFLSQAEKEGIRLYFACQDYSQTHKGFRIHVYDLALVVKLIGSPRPMKSAPPVNYIWGIVLYWDIDPRTFDGSNDSMERLHMIPHFYWINREDTELYDTSYRVKGISLPPLKMIPQEIHYYNEQGLIEKKKRTHVKR